MDDLKQNLEAVINNPQMMEQIMGMAQAFGINPPQTEQDSPAQNPPPAPDPSSLNMLTGMLGQANIDGDQKNLLAALSPYMSSVRISKLKRAMQAAKLAELATSLLGNLPKAGG